MPTADLFEGFEVISTYTRAQAIEDGVLVDLMQDELAPTVREAGFTMPIAMTVAAFVKTISPIDDERGLPEGQDIQGRLWDVLWMLRFAIQRGQINGSTGTYSLRVRNFIEGSKRSRLELVTLKSVCGPSDDGTPCITIMLPEED